MTLTFDFSIEIDPAHIVNPNLPMSSIRAHVLDHLATLIRWDANENESEQSILWIDVGDGSADNMGYNTYTIRSIK